MEYENFTADDFCLDEYFQEWVQNPTATSNYFWKEWLNQHPEKEETILEARKLVVLLHFNDEGISEGLIHKIWMGIDQNTHEIPSPVITSPSGLTYFVHNYWKMAAVFLFLLGFTAVFFIIKQNETESFATSYGETKEIVLDDGSIVTLNSNSSIKFDKDFDQKPAREVWVNGEAYFSVTHKKNNKKFIVHTQNLNVEVLGTEFNVNTRRNKVKVVLNSGKVKLNRSNSDKENIYMVPGELVEVSTNTNVTKKKVRPEDFSSWKDNLLVFNQTSLNEIAGILEDNYGYVVKIEEPTISTLTFTATVPAKNKDISLLLHLLEASFDIDVTQNSNTITIKNK